MKKTWIFSLLALSAATVGVSRWMTNTTPEAQAEATQAAEPTPAAFTATPEPTPQVRHALVATPAPHADAPVYSLEPRQEPPSDVSSAPEKAPTPVAEASEQPEEESDPDAPAPGTKEYFEKKGFKQPKHFRSPEEAQAYLEKAGAVCLGHDEYGMCTNYDKDPEFMKRNGFKCVARHSDGKCRTYQATNDVARALFEAFTVSSKQN